MRASLGVCLVMLGAACAHAPEKAPESPPAQTASADDLEAQARKSKDALAFSDCAEQFHQAAAASKDDDSRSDYLYNAASCAALAGKSSQAIEFLKKAVQHGFYEPDRLVYDWELSSLHTATGWDEVLAGAKANLAKAPHPPMPLGILRGIDVYGSRRADPEAVRKLLGFELGKPFVSSSVLFHQKEEALRKQYNLAFAEISVVYFFAAEYAGGSYMSVDLVDADDASRLKFLPVPSGHPADPEGLVALWREYDTRASQLMRKGAIDMETQAVCKVAHCFAGFGHPELARYEPIFLAKVPQQEQALVQVLREEADVEKRGAAALLLAYASTPERVVELLKPFTRDPDGLVRNNSIRVILANQDQANHPLIDLATVVDLLSMPENSDRNKGCYLLSYVLADMKPEEVKAQKAMLIRQLGQELVDMALMAQPMNREPAVEVLERLSGEKHEKVEEWKAWLARQPK